MSRDRGASIETFMQFEEVTEQACDESTPSGMTCKVLWHDWGIEILGQSGQPTAGAGGSGGAAGQAAPGGRSGAGSGADTADAGGHTPPKRDDGGCGVAAGHGASTGSAMTLIGVALFLRAQRRRRTPRR
jgi:MYXO-CTERM domain-containing protein